MIKNVELFKKQILNLQEVNIGDFRRRLVLYINRFSESNPSYSQITQEMKSIVLYQTITDMEEMREQLLNLIHRSIHPSKVSHT